MSEQSRTATMFPASAEVFRIEGSLHPDGFAVIRFQENAGSLHVHDPQILDKLASTAARLAAAMREAREKETTELAQLRAEVARLRAAAAEPTTAGAP